LFGQDNKPGNAGAPPAAPAAPPLPAGVGSTGGGANPLANQALPNDAKAGQSPIDNTNHSKSGRRRYSEDMRPDTGEAAGKLDQLREKSQDDFHPQHMDSYNDEIRDLVDDLQDAGVDASPIVARLHQADNPADGNPDFAGISSPGWADEPFSGSGPDHRRYFSDSASYVADLERPHIEDDWYDDVGEDIVKFNDSRSRPQQGPRHSSATVKRHGGPRRSPRIDPGTRQQRQMLRHAEGIAPAEEDATSLPIPDTADPLADSTDIVANFQRSAAAADLMSNAPSGGGGGGRFSDDDIANHAREAMLRTAGRKFTLAEQRELEEEEHHLGARNMPTDADLAGTHYLMGR
jgi:hypothetical protein